MPLPTAPHRFVVLVPVKPPATAKSRLVGLPDAVRRDLAAAFAEDTVAAARASDGVEQVLVVTDDARFASHLGSELGCQVMPDGADDDLNATLVQASREAGRRWPHLVPVALCADLPALRAEELAAVLAAWDASAPGFVPDDSGDGTTLYLAATAEFAPRFGPSSRAEHAAAGAHEISGAGRSVRQDVDEVGDLGRALLLGVGRRTAAAWGRDEGGSPAPG